jgi:N-acylneuraminate cytidylyltransferase/CMP-N,N'-diacetyllegionaminic acid synthase
MRRLALIPARGTSRRLPRKNVLPVGGRPLIAWTIEAALISGVFDRVVVSTDDMEIAEIARKQGAEVPFERPANLAADNASTVDVLLHALEWFDTFEDYLPTHLACLQPTSPLRTNEDIVAAAELARERDADAIVSVGPIRQHPAWIRRVGEDGRLEECLPGETTANLPANLAGIYALNGAIYLVKSSLLREHKSFYAGRTYAYVMPAERSIDIDTAWDLQQADLVLRARRPNETLA